MEKDFVVIDGTLMVREITKVQCSFSPRGKHCGAGVSVTMRPATRDEVSEYQLLNGVSHGDRIE